MSILACEMLQEVTSLATTPPSIILQIGHALATLDGSLTCAVYSFYQIVALFLINLALRLPVVLKSFV